MKIYDLLMWKYRKNKDIKQQIEWVRDRYGVEGFEQQAKWEDERTLYEETEKELPFIIKWLGRLVNAHKPHQHLMGEWFYLLRLKEQSK